MTLAAPLEGLGAEDASMRVVAFAVVALLAACASNSGVQPYSGDVLHVTRQGATGATSPSLLRGAAENDARTYCEGRGQRFALVEAIEAEPPFILGRFPRAEIRFRCIDNG